MALTLTAVGVTMYNGGSLQVHLAIYISVLTLAGVTAALLLPARRKADG